MDGYESPEFTPLIFCLFSNDLFGVLWIELGLTLSYFARDREIIPLIEQRNKLKGI